MTFAHIPAARIEAMNRPQLRDAIVLAMLEEIRRDGFPIDAIPGLFTAGSVIFRITSCISPTERLRRIALRSWRELE